MTELDKGRRRSFNVGSKKGRDATSQQDVVRGCSQSSSLYSKENSITEEEEEDEDDVFGESSVVQVDEISSSIIDIGGELEIEVGNTDDNDNNVTGRRKRKMKPLKSLVSLPSASKIREVMDEGEMDSSINLDSDEVVTKSPDAAHEREENVSSTRDLCEDDRGCMSVSSDDSAVSEYSSTSAKEMTDPKEVAEKEMKGPKLDLSIAADQSTLTTYHESNSTVEVSGIEPLIDVSYANSTGNSGVVTFKTQASVSGVYDSFSDDTRDEFLQDTEVQEESSDKIYEMHTCNEEDDDKFSNVKRRIFEGESGMESFLSVEAPGEVDVPDNVPFILGRVSSAGTSFESSGQFVLGSIDSDLPGDETNESTIGDDSVFSRSTQGGNSCLSYGFEVPEDQVEAVVSEATDVADEEMAVESPDDEDSNGDDGVPNILVSSPTIDNVPNDDEEDERCSSPEFIPASPRLSTVSSYHTAPTSRNTTDLLSPMFDTTAEEMMLFEMFGETYDEQVEAMSMEERVNLKMMLFEMFGETYDEQVEAMS